MISMGDKKTEVMTIRVTSKTKQAIMQEAEKREWTASKMAEKILTTWAESNSEEK